VQRNLKAVGCDGTETKMNTLNQTSAKTTSALTSVLFVAMLGATTLFLTGFAQSQTLHDAAHDVRHSTGFPCH
jgi:cobalt transporter subunit CbtB